MTLGPLTFWSGALWLMPPVLAALLLLRFYQTRRTELLAGSLLIWRRLAAQQPKVRRKRIQVDRSLLLQAAALFLLILALAGPRLDAGGSRGRSLLVVLDNGPLARARQADGARFWGRIKEKAAFLIRRLDAQDRVFLARAAPLPKVIAEALSPAAALQQLDALQPALSGPESAGVWLFAVDAARSLNRGAAVPLVVVSLRDGPPGASGSQWACVAPPEARLRNVAIVNFGSVPVLEDGREQVQMLARVCNFSDAPAAGVVRCEGLNGAAAQKRERRCEVAPHGDESAVFTLPMDAGAVRLSWQPEDGKADAQPEDDTVLAAARRSGAPRMRFFGPAPALEKLYRSALRAEIIPADDKSIVDLEIYVGTLPEAGAERARALMLLAPESGYRTAFDVGSELLANLHPQCDEQYKPSTGGQPLMLGIKDTPEGLFAVPRACKLLRTGDFASLIKDRDSNRCLVGRFSDERQRPHYLFAFVPGAGFAPERLLDWPLAVLLVRMAREAAGAGEPYVSTPAAVLEQHRGEALPADWLQSASSAAEGLGVLDARASDLALGSATSPAAQAGAGVVQMPDESWNLAPPLILLALLLLAIELWLSRPAAGVGRSSGGEAAQA